MDRSWSMISFFGGVLVLDLSAEMRRPLGRSVGSAGAQLSHVLTVAHWSAQNSPLVGGLESSHSSITEILC